MKNNKETMLKYAKAYTELETSMMELLQSNGDAICAKHPEVFSKYTLAMGTQFFVKSCDIGVRHDEWNGNLTFVDATDERTWFWYDMTTNDDDKFKNDLSDEIKSVLAHHRTLMNIVWDSGIKF